jgi:acyl transferase domain-containing protein
MASKDPDNFPKSLVTSTAPSVLANRVSWYFDLKGPSVHVDTACSSSLVALDFACQSIRSGSATAVGCDLFLQLKDYGVGSS